MIDIEKEQLHPIARAAGFVPGARGKKCHASTILRWILDGAKSPTGERVRLEAIRRPCGWLTSREAVQRFLEALTPDLTQAGNERRKIRPPATRERASRRAERKLERLGI
jgi:hypothetical protein